MRHLDLLSLRSLVAIVESGGMTRAAARLHLTQSAVSMQIKRLEQALDTTLLDRAGRTVRPTPQGEQLVDFARQMLALNDDAWHRLTTPRFEGTLAIGVPSDIVYPHIPDVLRRFGREFPSVQVSMTNANSADLRRQLEMGEHDLILTTESRAGRGGKVVARRSLEWTGARGGRAWQNRPLPLAFCTNCMFREPVLIALRKAKIAWVDVVNTISDDGAAVVVAADMAIRADLHDSYSPGIEVLDHRGTLPALPEFSIIQYLGDGPRREVAEAFAAIVRNV